MCSRTLCWISLTSFKLNTGHSVGNPVTKKVLHLSLGRVGKDPSLTTWAAAASHLANVHLGQTKGRRFPKCLLPLFQAGASVSNYHILFFHCTAVTNVCILSQSKSQKSHFASDANLSAFSPILSFHFEIQFSLPFLHSFFCGGGEGGGHVGLIYLFFFCPPSFSLLSSFSSQPLNP